MRRFRLLFLGVSVLLTAFAAQAEATEFDFTGAGPDGIIIWDGDFDVSTMRNNCAGLCSTTDYLAGSTITVKLISSDTASINFFSLFVVMSMPYGEVPIGQVPDACAAPIQCGHVSYMSAFSSELPSFPAPGDPGDTNYGVVLLPVLLPAGGTVLAGSPLTLDPASLAFLATHSPADPSDPDKAWKFGLYAEFQEIVLDPDPTFPKYAKFRLEVDATGGTAPAAVPEPASLVLLGTGIAGLVARRRSRRS